MYFSISLFVFGLLFTTAQVPQVRQLQSIPINKECGLTSTNHPTSIMFYWLLFFLAFVPFSFSFDSTNLLTFSSSSFLFFQIYNHYSLFYLLLFLWRRQNQNYGSRKKIMRRKEKEKEQKEVTENMNQQGKILIKIISLVMTTTMMIIIN